jgi:hypothetical protein
MPTRYSKNGTSLEHPRIMWIIQDHPRIMWIIQELPRIIQGSSKEHMEHPGTSKELP